MKREFTAVAVGLGLGLILFGAALAADEENCDEATFHLYGTEVDNHGVRSVLVVEYDLLGGGESNCLVPRQFPIIVPKSELHCEQEIRQACGLPTTVFKRWSLNVFPSAEIHGPYSPGGEIVVAEEEEPTSDQISYFKVKQKSGRSLLHILAARADARTVGEIVGRGIDLNVLAGDGRTPLHDAVSWNREKVVALFVAAGARVNTRDLEGRTPLHSAAAGGNAAIVESLLAHGADIEALDNDGRTPLQIATARRHWSSAALLGAKAAEE